MDEATRLANVERLAEANKAAIVKLGSSLMGGTLTEDDLYPPQDSKVGYQEGVPDA